MLSDQSLAFARAFVPGVSFISLSLDTLCRLYRALLRYLRSTICGPYLLIFFVCPWNVPSDVFTSSAGIFSMIVLRRISFFCTHYLDSPVALYGISDRIFSTGPVQFLPLICSDGPREDGLVLVQRDFAYLLKSAKNCDINFAFSDLACPERFRSDILIATVRSTKISEEVLRIPILVCSWVRK